MSKALYPEQLTLFSPGEPSVNYEKSSTFLDNQSLPIHRWFRYSAGFSAIWVNELIEREKNNGRNKVFDPFAGSGTVLLQSEVRGVESKGIEAHPFIIRIAKAKLLWREDPERFYQYAALILKQAKSTGMLTDKVKNYPPLIEKCFPEDTLFKLAAIQSAWESAADNTPFSELSWLALVSILRKCSPVGTAQWQYIQPRKSKSKSLDPYEAFLQTASMMRNDMTLRQRLTRGPKPDLNWDDARECKSIPEKWADLVITSPPYVNNYDYADATRLEMSFMGDIRGWGDLQDEVRKYLVRSCTQHIAKIENMTHEFIDDPLLSPIYPDISDVCKRLDDERKMHGGKKPYHTMVAAYFKDMAAMWISLRRITADGCLVCFVIGDSAPYGIYVPVDEWMGRLAVAAGFKSYSFEKTRDRNIKWKNRKHRVPLHEGHLRIEG